MMDNLRVTKRLDALNKEAKEEDANSIGIVADSLRNFNFFIRQESNLKYPDITLTPDNHIYACWRAKPNKLFSVHFLPNGDTSFVIFNSDVRMSGVTMVDKLMNIVIANGVNKWILENE